MKLLGGVERKVCLGKKRRKTKERDGIKEEEKISKEEVNEAIKKIKDGKAKGMDGIPREAWKYGGRELKEWIWRYCNKV